MESHIQLIRERCIAANGDIMKLQFGCELLYGDTRVQYISQRQETTGFYIEICPSVNGNNEVWHKEAIILGRPIRLADVLLAIEGCMGRESVERGHITVCEHGEFHEDENPKYVKWNLRKDSLTDQSPETIEFIYNLLK